MATRATLRNELVAVWLAGLVAGVVRLASCRQLVGLHLSESVAEVQAHTRALLHVHRREGAMAAIPRTRGIDVERCWCDVHDLDQDGLPLGSPARRLRKSSGTISYSWSARSCDCSGRASGRAVAWNAGPMPTGSEARGEGCSV
jgi:hypothetical protein